MRHAAITRLRLAAILVAAVLASAHPRAERMGYAPEEFAARRNTAVARLERAGAHFVVDGVADILPAILSIEERLARDERP